MTTLATVMVAVVLAGCGAQGQEGDEDEVVVPVTEEPLEVLLDAESETVLDQPLTYPRGRPEVSASLLTLEPGERTGPHTHEAPMLAWVLEGEVSVDYGGDGTRTYTEGETIMEAVGVVHNGTSSGETPARLLVVNLGSNQVENTVVVD